MIYLRVTLKHGLPHWCNYWCTLVLWYLDKVKIFFQCIKYLVFTLNSNKHRFKYIWCKISIQRDLIFRGLLAFLFFHRVSTRMICLWILQTILYHFYFSSRLIYYLVKSSFWFFNFDRVMPKSANWNCRKHFGVILTECSPSSLLYLWIVY